MNTWKPKFNRYYYLQYQRRERGKEKFTGIKLTKHVQGFIC